MVQKTAFLSEFSLLGRSILLKPILIQIIDQSVDEYYWYLFVCLFICLFVYRHLAEQPYSHISATYYILAEKFLRRKQAFNSSIRRKKVFYQESLTSSGSEDDADHRTFQRYNMVTREILRIPYITITLLELDCNFLRHLLLLLLLLFRDYI